MVEQRADFVYKDFLKKENRYIEEAVFYQRAMRKGGPTAPLYQVGVFNFNTQKISYMKALLLTLSLFRL